MVHPHSSETDGSQVRIEPVRGSANNSELANGSPAVQPPARTTTTTSRGGKNRVSSTAQRLAVEGDELESAEPVETALKLAPPWLVSLIVHMCLLVILGLIMIGVGDDSPVRLKVTHSDRQGEQLEELVDLVADEPAPDLEPIFSPDALIPTDDPLAGLLSPQLDSPLDSSPIAPDARNLGLALTGRTEGRKVALLNAYGGTATTENAVYLGLKWLARNQDSRSGSWSLMGRYKDGSRRENRPAATAMALLAFLGAGHTHERGEFHSHVALGLKALRKMQKADGSFFNERDQLTHRQYTNALATIVVCELFGMTSDSSLRRPAEKAIHYLVAAQSPEGGWRYQARHEADTSVTGWVVMALQSGRMAGLTVPTETLEKVHEFLDSVSTDYQGRYRYLPSEFESATNAMTAEALLCRQYLGWPRSDPRLVEAVEFLLGNPISAESRDSYYWYYATQVMHHMGGDAWNEWNGVMREVIPSHQVKDGKEAGSWDPYKPASDRWGEPIYGGRLFVTCLSIYMLEVYYRHLPLYDKIELP